MGMLIGAANFWKTGGASGKIKIELPYDLAVPLLRFICQIALAQGVKKSVIYVVK